MDDADAVYYPGMWKQSKYFVTFGYPNPACDCDPIQGPVKAETHGKAKRKHGVKAILLSPSSTTSALFCFPCNAVQCTGGQSETQYVYTYHAWIVTIVGSIYSIVYTLPLLPHAWVGLLFIYYSTRYICVCKCLYNNIICVNPFYSTTS